MLAKNKNICLAFLFILTFFCIDRIVGYAFGSQFQKISSEGYGKLNYLLDGNDNEVLILGNSRAEHHYVSNMLSDSLGLSVYNFGLDGDGIIINCARIESAINKYQPKLLIVEVPFDLLVWETASVHMSHLHPFYKRDSSFHAILNEFDWAMPIKQMLHSYRYNSTFSNWLKLRNDTRDTLNGYNPIFAEMNTNTGIEQFSFSDKPADKKVYKLLYNTVKECKEKSVEVVFMISPYYYSINADKAKNALSQTYKLCNELNVPIFDNTQLEGVYDNPAYFKDKEHLNHTGAMVYTNEVLKQLRSAGLYNK